MKILKFIIFAFLCAFYSCGYLIGEKHKVEFDCNKTSIVSIQPPEGTFKCNIKCIRNECNLNSEVFLLYNNNTKIDLNNSEVLFSQDWYDMKLGLKYVPSVEDSFNVNGHKIQLQVTFYY